MVFSSMQYTLKCPSCVCYEGIVPSSELDHVHARAAKIILRLSWDISDQEALESTRWKPLSNQYKKKLITLMYKVNSNTTSVKITNLFCIAYPHYNLRNSNHLVLLRYNLDIARNRLRYRGPLVWELTPTSLKQSHSLKNFKNRLKQRHQEIYILYFIDQARV